MRTYSYNGNPVYPRNELVLDDGTRYPKGLWTTLSEEVLKAMGVSWSDIPQPKVFDRRFYWSAGVPKELEDRKEVDQEGEPILDDKGVQLVTQGLKSNAIKKVKADAASRIEPTEWIVSRSLDPEGKAVPVEVWAYRKEVRDASDALEDLIRSCASVEELVSLYTPPLDEEGHPIEEAPINKWPEPVL